MSQLLISNYIHEIESLIQHGGPASEGSIRKAFSNLHDAYCKPRDPTIREKFNTYRFADYKEQVIDLLQRVTTVSVETQRIVAAMP